MPKLLGEHLGNRKKWSVSIETGLVYSEAAIFDPRDGSVKEMSELDEETAKAVKKIKGVPTLGKAGGVQLAWCLGGVDGQNDFALNGIGYVGVPAEKSAKITQLSASEGVEGGVMLAAGSVPDFYPGLQVSWHRLAASCWGRGEVIGVEYEGEHDAHGMSFIAAAEDPLLHIELPSGTKILRPSSSVRCCM